MIKLFVAFDDGNAQASTLDDWGDALNVLGEWMSQLLGPKSPSSPAVIQVELSLVDEALNVGTRRESESERALRSYYFAFQPTGNDDIDAVLEAVASAGKAYHHTEWWNVPDVGQESETSKIQRAAQAAADAARRS